MSDKIKNLTTDNFSAITSVGTVLVDFWAPWCGPCKAQTPILDRVADKVGTMAVIAKVNVDESPELAAQFSVRSIPTLVLFKDGKRVNTYIGVQQEAALVEILTA